MKSILSDKDWRQYWDELMSKSKDPVLWGTIVEEKPKHKNLTTEEDTKTHNDQHKKRKFKTNK